MSLEAPLLCTHFFYRQPVPFGRNCWQWRFWSETLLFQPCNDCWSKSCAESSLGNPLRSGARVRSVVRVSVRQQEPRPPPAPFCVFRVCSHLTELPLPAPSVLLAERALQIVKIGQLVPVGSSYETASDPTSDTQPFSIARVGSGDLDPVRFYSSVPVLWRETSRCRNSGKQVSCLTFLTELINIFHNL